MEKIFVHLSHVESLPQVGNTHFLVPHIFEPDLWVVTLSLNSDEAFLNCLFHELILSIKASLYLLVKPLLGHTHQVDIKVEPELGDKSDRDGLLALSIDNPFRSVKCEVVIEDFGQLCHFFGIVLLLSATLLFILWGHFKLDENVAVATVIDCALRGLVEANGDRTEVKVVRLDLQGSIASSSKDLKTVLLEANGCLLILHGLLLPTSWAIKAHRIFQVIINIPCINWDSNVVVLLFECSKGCIDLGLFVGLEEGLGRGELDLVLVLLGDFPLVLQRDSGVVLHEDGLLRGDADVSWWEEELLLVTQLKFWLIAVTDKVDLVHVRRVVVEHALCHKVIVSGCFGVELEANDGETLSSDEAMLWIGFESLRLVG